MKASQTKLVYHFSEGDKNQEDGTPAWAPTISRPRSTRRLGVRHRRTAGRVLAADGSTAEMGQKRVGGSAACETAYHPPR